MPTPGSPASSTTAPGTIPPPSTRSSSPTPVGRARALSALTSPMGRAGSAGRTAAARAGAALAGPAPPADSTNSSRVPHSRHSRHCPSHLGLVQPHSVQT